MHYIQIMTKRIMLPVWQIKENTPLLLYLFLIFFTNFHILSFTLTINKSCSLQSFKNITTTMSFRSTTKLYLSIKSDIINTKELIFWKSSSMTHLVKFTSIFQPHQMCTSSIRWASKTTLSTPSK